MIAELVMNEKPLALTMVEKRKKDGPFCNSGNWIELTRNIFSHMDDINVNMI
jgi:hypothetical protein